jgi:hypothetical protein
LTGSSPVAHSPLGRLATVRRRMDGHLGGRAIDYLVDPHSRLAGGRIRGAPFEERLLPSPLAGLRRPTSPTHTRCDGRRFISPSAPATNAATATGSPGRRCSGRSSARANSPATACSCFPSLSASALWVPEWLCHQIGAVVRRSSRLALEGFAGGDRRPRAYYRTSRASATNSFSAGYGTPRRRPVPRGVAGL